MDLSGYGYRRSALSQQIPQVTTGRTLPATQPSAQLSGEALRLLVKLDAKVDLQELSARFPRVLNRIAEVWGKPEQADRCFDELLLHSRSVRQGFPQIVICEIASLRHYYLIRMIPRRVDPLGADDAALNTIACDHLNTVMTFICERRAVIYSTKRPVARIVWPVVCQ
jgi:hypothetical protein